MEFLRLIYLRWVDAGAAGRVRLHLGVPLIQRSVLLLEEDLLLRVHRDGCVAAAATCCSALLRPTHLRGVSVGGRVWLGMVVNHRVHICNGYVFVGHSDPVERPSAPLISRQVRGLRVCVDEARGRCVAITTLTSCSQLHLHLR